MTVLPSSLVSKLSAALRTGLRSSSSLTSGSMMLSRMLEEVVSVARPGSSDGGSVPQFTVITCSAASAPPSRASRRYRRASRRRRRNRPRPARDSRRAAPSQSQRVFVLMCGFLPFVSMNAAARRERRFGPCHVYRPQTCEPVSFTSRIRRRNAIYACFALVTAQPAHGAHVDVRSRASSSRA